MAVPPTNASTTVVRKPTSTFSPELFDVAAAVDELCAPVEAKVEAKVEVPFRALVETPVEAPVEVPFKALVKAPVALGMLVTLGLVLTAVLAVVFTAVTLLPALVVDRAIVPPPVAVAK